MVRSLLLATTVASLLWTVACDNASNDDKKARAAQMEANDKSGAAVKEADDKVKSAQAEAAETVAGARADFMKLREDYRHTTTVNLVELDDKVAGLVLQSKQSSGERKAELDANLKQIHVSRDVFGRDYQALESESESSWDETKARLDKEWSNLKALVDKA
jgi:hypothetical protein